MKITVTIVADCDPPPVHDVHLDEDLDKVCEEAENALADAILTARGSFSIDSSYRIEG